MSQEITVDFSEQIVETKIKIERLENLIHYVKNQKNALEHYKKSDVLLTDKVGLNLSGFIQCSFNASVATLIPLLEQNIEDDTALIHELAKELGIEVE
ncbi:DUF1359 domain-containing protein [Lactococcus cremoris]|uniref:DUF1359 domain-containing protein n=1 Tax=Lactococcus lactis subsp. cremoris TaxID=1359 RepID=UPI0021821760|nr:DUF1359 domain-containing protein [Lactococcus cremoris]MCT0502012.1 DUF1359 domain-containing protein [Lactococcus cremoris]